MLQGVTGWTTVSKECCRALNTHTASSFLNMLHKCACGQGSLCSFCVFFFQKTTQMAFSPSYPPEGREGQSSWANSSCGCNTKNHFKLRRHVLVVSASLHVKRNLLVMNHRNDPWKAGLQGTPCLLKSLPVKKHSKVIWYLPLQLSDFVFLPISIIFM